MPYMVQKIYHLKIYTTQNIIKPDNSDNIYDIVACLIDKNGKVVHKNIYDATFSQEYNHWEITDINGKMTFLNEKNNFPKILFDAYEQLLNTFIIYNNDSLCIYQKNKNICSQWYSSDFYNYTYQNYFTVIHETDSVSEIKYFDQDGTPLSEWLTWSGDNLPSSTDSLEYYTFYNLKGEIISDKMLYLDELKNGLFAIQKNGLWGAVDYKGDTKIDFSYEAIEPFCDGYAPIKLKDKWGFIDANAKIVTECKFDELEKIAKNIYLTVQNEQIFIANAKGEILAKFPKTMEEFFVMTNNLHIGWDEDMELDEIIELIYLTNKKEFDLGQITEDIFAIQEDNNIRFFDKYGYLSTWIEDEPNIDIYENYIELEWWDIQKTKIIDINTWNYLENNNIEIEIQQFIEYNYPFLIAKKNIDDTEYIALFSKELKLLSDWTISDNFEITFGNDSALLFNYRYKKDTLSYLTLYQNGEISDWKYTKNYMELTYSFLKNNQSLMLDNFYLVAINSNPTILTLQKNNKIPIEIELAFPAYYFNKYSYLTYNFTISNSEHEYKTKSRTLQGEYVRDNNEIIRYQRGGRTKFRDTIYYNDKLKFSELKINLISQENNINRSLEQRLGYGINTLYLFIEEGKKIDSLLLENEQYQKAVQQMDDSNYKEALSYFGDDNSFNKALTMIQLYKYTEALQILNNLNSEHALSYYLKAIVYTKLHDTENALLNLKTAILKDETLKNQARTEVFFNNYIITNNTEFLEIIKF